MVSDTDRIILYYVVWVNSVRLFLASTVITRFDKVNDQLYQLQ